MVSTPIPRATAVDAVDETGRVLKKASVAGRAETERVSLDQAGIARLDQAVGQTPGTPEKRSGITERALIEDVNRKLEPALSRVEPEGRALVAQSSAAPAMRAPESTSAAAQPVRARAVDEEGAAPIPLVRAKRDSEAAPPTAPGGKTDAAGDSHIDIVCQGALYFDSAQSMAVFTDDVVVNHPQFHLTSDELQVYMLKEGETKPKEVPPPKPPVPGEAPKPKSDTSVKQAIATGRKVVIQKRSETGWALAQLRRQR